MCTIFYRCLLSAVFPLHSRKVILLANFFPDFLVSVVLRQVFLRVQEMGYRLYSCIHKKAK